MMTIEDFLFNLPTYHKVKNEECKDIIDFLSNGVYHNYEIDGYNPIMQCDSTFILYSSINTTVQNPIGRSSIVVESVSGKTDRFNTFEVILKCKRYGIFLHYLIHIGRNEDGDVKFISKVGQYPSVADFHIGQIHKYDKVLTKDKMKELTKAIGLAANGIGIGSFVYLRRIFEYLVFEAFEIAKTEKLDFDVNAFAVVRMNEKIQMLSGFLPSFLVENYAIYGILSKGIHELSEEECKRMFSNNSKFSSDIPLPLSSTIISLTSA
jgi:hypothetical protein